MKKNVQSLGLGFLFLLIVLAASKCEAQRNLTGRQLKFETGVQHAIDTVEATGNEGRIWYDFVTGKFRANQGGVNTGLIGGGSGAYWPLAGNAELLDQVDINTGAIGWNIGQGDGLNVTRGGHSLYGIDGGMFLSFIDASLLYETVFAVSSNTINAGSSYPNFTGLVYSADYSADYTDRSLPDWGNVWRTKGTTNTSADGFQINFSDGGFMAGTFEFLPFTLSQWTMSEFANPTVFSRIEMVPQGITLIASASTGSSFVFDDSNIILTDGRVTKKGIEYGADYSANYSSRSLTDVAYVQNRTLEGSATLNFPSTTATTVSRLTITVAGAADGDPVSLGVPNASITATGTYFAYVSAANTVTVQFSPKATEDPASGTFKVTVHKP